MSTGYKSNYPTSGYASETQLRNEFQKIQDALEDTISRTGEGIDKGQDNSMNSDLDLNSNDLFGVRALNAEEIRTQVLTIGGVGIQTLVDEATAQADRAEAAADELSGPYEFVGDYAPDITLTKYKQLVRDSKGEFWRVSGQVVFPYTTTGTGLPEDDSFIPAGDAVLRQDLANPNLGAAMVAYKGGTVAGKLDGIASEVSSHVTSEADRAEAARDDAQGALDAVMNSPLINSVDMYLTTALGIAGTDDGDMFWVFPNNDNNLENLVLYQNSNGTAVELHEQYDLNQFLYIEGQNHA